MTTALGLVAAALLIAANGWFVAAEFAYVAVRKPKLEEQARGEGRRARRAGRALRVSRRLSFVLSGAQLGITVTSLVLGFLAEPAIAQALEPVFRSLGVGDAAISGISLVTALFLATSIQMVFGELVPKNLAIAKPEPFALALASGVLAYTRVARPVIRLFDGAANRLLRLLGIEPVEELGGGVTVEELDFIVEESARVGVLDERKALLLARALDFRERQAKEVMIPRPHVVSVPATASGRHLRELLRTPFSRFPVVAEEGDLDEIVGVVHAEDLVRFPPDERDDVPLGGLVRTAVYVPETALVTTIIERLRVEGCEMAIVVDEYGGTSGILTREDLAEELVGDIFDEHDPLGVGIEESGVNTWTVPGRFRLDEVLRETGVDLPEGDEYDTVAGLVMNELGRVPVVGDRVEVMGAVLTVLDMRKRQVVLLSVEARPLDEDQR